jgi:hypothetical protein
LAADGLRFCFDASRAVIASVEEMSLIAAEQAVNAALAAGKTMINNLLASR